ncbi:MAG TPA: hypothetical protein VMW08_00660 [Acidimicrobiales bacterium]|nr:hypothetical protein [Acidimicrobiales bacterium]
MSTTTTTNRPEADMAPTDTPTPGDRVTHIADRDQLTWIVDTIDGDNAHLHKLVAPGVTVTYPTRKLARKATR